MLYIYLHTCYRSVTGLNFYMGSHQLWVQWSVLPLNRLNSIMDLGVNLTTHSCLPGCHQYMTLWHPMLTQHTLCMSWKCWSKGWQNWKQKKMTAHDETVYTPNDTGIPDLTSEQTMMIEMMSTNPFIGWKVAFWKLLMVVFGEARFCCKERKNATFQPLDGTKLNAVKGIWHNI